MPILRHWRIFELTGLDAAAEDARRLLAEHLDKLEVAAQRFEEKMAAARRDRPADPRRLSRAPGPAEHALVGRAADPGPSPPRRRWPSR